MTSIPQDHFTQAIKQYAEILTETPTLTWKKFADDQELKLYIFAPDGHTPQSESIPAVVFFHGGMWIDDHMEELVPWAIHLNRLGIFCILPEYRTRNKYEVHPEEILEDGLDFWHWIYENAAQFGINQHNITLAGTDAGAIMALLPAMPPSNSPEQAKWWKPFVKPSYPSMPAAVAIFRGVVDLDAPEAQKLLLSKDMTHARNINPALLLRKMLPPLFCAHGMLDPLQDYESTEWLCDEWKSWDNKAEACMIPQGDHALMNFIVQPLAFEQMLLAWEHFMVEQGLWPDRGESYDDIFLML